MMMMMNNKKTILKCQTPEGGRGSNPQECVHSTISNPQPKGRTEGAETEKEDHVGRPARERNDRHYRHNSKRTTTQSKKTRSGTGGDSGRVGAQRQKYVHTTTRTCSNLRSFYTNVDSFVNKREEYFNENSRCIARYYWAY